MVGFAKIFWNKFPTEYSHMCQERQQQIMSSDCAMKIPFCTILAVLSVVANVVRADITTNLPASADTSLLESNPDNNLGALSEIPDGSMHSLGPPPRSRALFKFDLTQIPADATISAASLTIQVVKKPTLGVGSSFDLHAVLQDWGEGVGSAVSFSQTGDPANPGEATWNNRLHPSTAWSAPGGAADVDYVGAASATTFMNDVGPYTFGSSAGMISDVQSWVNTPSANFGWMLISQSEGTAYTARRIASREDTINPPFLTITYTAPTQPPPPVPPTLSQIAVAGGRFVFTFNAQSNRTYVVESRPDAASGSWTTVTNIPALTSDSAIAVSDPISGGRNFYRVHTP